MYITIVRPYLILNATNRVTERLAVAAAHAGTVAAEDQVPRAVTIYGT